MSPSSAVTLIHIFQGHIITTFILRIFLLSFFLPLSFLFSWEESNCSHPTVFPSAFVSLHHILRLSVFLYCCFDCSLTIPLPHRKHQCHWVSLAPYCPPAQKSQSVFNELCVCGSQPEAVHYWPVGICFSLPSPVSFLLLCALFFSLPIKPFCLLD